MKAKPEFPETLQDAIKYFADDDRALEFMKAIRWPDGKVNCPRCQSSDTVFMPARRLWRCRSCQKQSSVKVGTIFEESPLGLDKWLPAMWMILNAKNGISSCELARALGVTQKTAWFMLHRIRLAMRDEMPDKLSGEIEIDETFVGGKAVNMHKSKRRVKTTGCVGKIPVMGMLQRSTHEKHSRVVLKMVRTIRRTDLLPHVKNHVEEGSEIHTDALRSYRALDQQYIHNVVDHAVSYVQGHVHTNGMENFWSLLKRTIKGTYVSVEPFHLFRYLDEQAFRFNERKNTDAGRFLIGIVGVIGRRLKYVKLITEDAGSDWPPTTGPWQTA